MSTIKHETIYYPNKIKQIIDKLNNEPVHENERKQIETINELISYYKDIFMILSSCAARQLEEITFKRGIVKAQDLADYAKRYMKRAGKRLLCKVELKIEVENVSMLGDMIQLKYMLENLIDEALSYEIDGSLYLHIYKDKDFVRFDFIDQRRDKTQEELNQLFYPHLSQMKRGSEGVLTGTEYLICKQVIRDHDEFAGRRGCRINAQPVSNGGTEEIFRHEIPNAEVIGTAMTENEFWELLKVHTPDMVLLDLGLGGSTTIGVDICSSLRKNHPEIKVLIFTGEVLNEKLWVDVLNAGADGIILKTGELLTATDVQAVRKLSSIMILMNMTNVFFVI